ncbi:MAG: putative metal-binding motif-containing protein [Myxococcota bacterium]
MSRIEGVWLRRAAGGAGLLLAVACSGSTGSTTGGADGGGTCVVAADCDDGLFCTGALRCDPGDPGADAQGCVAEAACAPGETCDEALDRCMTDCADADADGQTDAACGGADCNDANPDVFAGALELCDAGNVDEDCDPSTFGSVDADGDGFVSAVCCNGGGAGLSCGRDCDDTRAGVNPTTAEVCDGIDNNCDGRIDESGQPVLWYPDADGDLFGDADAEPVVSCSPPSPSAVSNAGDCNDRDAAINPSAPERVGNGLDDDCNGRVDEPPTQLFEAGIRSVGGSTRRGGAVLGHTGLETFQRVCVAGACITGGIAP